MLTHQHLPEFERQMLQANCAAIDTETTGLSPWRDSLVGISIYPLVPDANAWYVPVGHGQGTLFGAFINADDLTQMAVRRIITNANKDNLLWLLWNAPFDHHFLTNGEYVGVRNKIDVQMLWHLIDERPSNKLMNRAQTVGVDIAGFDEELQKRGGQKKIGKMDPAEVYDYAAGDAWATGQLAINGWEQIKQHPELLQVLERECRITETIISMEQAGVPVNTKQTLAHKLHAQAKMLEINVRINNAVGRRVNPGSPEEMQRVLGMTTTRKNALEESQNPIAAMLREWRQWEKSVSSFYTVILDSVVNGRIHPSINQCGTETGRWSCSGPNLQALAREGDVFHVRDCIEAEPGMALVFWDYSQMELRMVAHYAADANMIRVLASGEDIHADTARVIFRHDPSKRERQIGKTINFAMTYGAGAKELALQLKMKEEEAYSILQRYRQAHPAIGNLSRRAETIAKTRGYIKLWGGRRRHYDPRDDAGCYKAMSNLIQGSVAEVVKDATLRAQPIVEKYGGRLLLQVHDELIAEVPEAVATEVALACCPPMEDYPFTCPMKVDCSTGKRWSKKTPIERP